MASRSLPATIQQPLYLSLQRRYRQQTGQGQTHACRRHGMNHAPQKTLPENKYCNHIHTTSDTCYRLPTAILSRSIHTQICTAKHSAAALLLATVERNKKNTIRTKFKYCYHTYGTHTYGRYTINAALPRSQRSRSDFRGRMGSASPK